MKIHYKNLNCYKCKTDNLKKKYRTFVKGAAVSRTAVALVLADGSWLSFGSVQSTNTPNTQLISTTLHILCALLSIQEAEQEFSKKAKKKYIL